MGLEISGLGGLIVLLADIWAIVKTIQSSASTGSKVIWIAIVILLPILGLILWFLFGPSDTKAA